jgi:flagellar basal-body rod protein FlgB
MDALSAIMTLKALDGLSARATVTAQNIANAGTANYRPLKVDFEQALAAAAPHGAGAVQAVQAQVLRDQGPAASAGLRLDLEMATAATTTTRYAALIEMLSRQMQIESLAITGN